MTFLSLFFKAAFSLDQNGDRLNEVFIGPPKYPSSVRIVFLLPIFRFLDDMTISDSLNSEAAALIVSLIGAGMPLGFIVINSKTVGTIAASSVLDCLQFVSIRNNILYFTIMIEP
jgi:hypothetical protein